MVNVSFLGVFLLCKCVYLLNKILHYTKQKKAITYDYCQWLGEVGGLDFDLQVLE